LFYFGIHGVKPSPASVPPLFPFQLLNPSTLRQVSLGLFYVNGVERVFEDVAEKTQVYHGIWVSLKDCLCNVLNHVEACHFSFPHRVVGYLALRLGSISIVSIKEVEDGCPLRYLRKQVDALRDIEYVLARVWCILAL
jgi:hypothetical protein